MSLFRKFASVSTVGMIDFRSDKDRITRKTAKGARASRRAAREAVVQTRLLQEQNQLLQRSAEQVPNPALAAARSVEDRLQQLEHLATAGVITEQERDARHAVSHGLRNGAWVVAIAAAVTLGGYQQSIEHFAPTTTALAAAGSASATTSPSGEPMPLGDLPGWHQIFAEDFTKDAPLGSWGSDCDPNRIVYTGATGTQWRSYPNCYLDTRKHPYRADQVLSVQNGMLDFYLHNVDGVPAGANPSPVLSGGTQYQTYGRYSARFRLDNPNLSEYYIAWLLWPQNDTDWQCAESDYPEGLLSSSTLSAFAHYGCHGAQDEFPTTADRTAWHTYTQEWMPGVRKYYLDGRLVGTSTNLVHAGPERWQLQTESSGNTGPDSGNLLVDWVVVYSYVPHQ